MSDSNLIDLDSFAVNQATLLETGELDRPTNVQETIEQPASDAWTPTHALIASGGVLFFGLVVVLVMTILILKGKNAAQVTRSLALPVIVVSAIVLAILGFGKDQIQPIIALLGTLAGFVLGSEHKSKSD